MRKTNGPRARATLAWGLVLFVTTQVAGSVLLDYVWTDLRFPSAAAVVDRFYRQPSPQVVFFGSSRFAALFPDEMASLLQRSGPAPHRPCTVLSASVPYGDCIASEFLLGKLIRAGARPRLVVVEVMPEYFTCFNEWHGFHVRRQFCWEDLPEHGVEICRSGQAARFFSARLLGMYVHRGAVCKTLVRSMRGTEPQPPPSVAPALTGPVDWAPLLRPLHLEMTPRLQAILASGYGPQAWLRHYRFGGNGTRALERILTLCRDRGIDVLLVASPGTRMFREGYPPEVEASYRRCLTGLQARFPCRFLDCRDWLEDTLFADSHHQHALGGLHYSRLLVHRVLAPWWRQECSRSPVESGPRLAKGKGP